VHCSIYSRTAEPQTRISPCAGVLVLLTYFVLTMCGWWCQARMSRFGPNHDVSTSTLCVHNVLVASTIVCFSLPSNLSYLSVRSLLIRSFPWFLCRLTRQHISIRITLNGGTPPPPVGYEKVAAGKHNHVYQNTRGSCLEVNWFLSLFSFKPLPLCMSGRLEYLKILFYVILILFTLYFILIPKIEPNTEYLKSEWLNATKHLNLLKLGTIMRMNIKTLELTRCVYK